MKDAMIGVDLEKSVLHVHGRIEVSGGMRL